MCAVNVEVTHLCGLIGGVRNVGSRSLRVGAHDLNDGKSAFSSFFGGRVFLSRLLRPSPKA